MTASQPRLLQLVTGLEPARALGLAVAYLMTKPAFAAQPFGAWSRVLVGQINRGHYVLATDGSRTVGFLGWALTSTEVAEQWIQATREPTSAESRAGEILLVNAWASDDEQVTEALLGRLREVGRTQKMVYFKRYYEDGRVRPGRLSVNAFVDAHIRRAHQSTRPRPDPSPQ